MSINFVAHQSRVQYGSTHDDMDVRIWMENTRSLTLLLSHLFLSQHMIIETVTI